MNFLSFVSLLATFGYAFAQSNPPYYGKLMQMGWGPNSSLTGDIYAVNDQKLQIVGFSTTGLQRCHRFVAGNQASPNGLDPTAVELIMLNGRWQQAIQYSGEILKLPEGMVFADFQYVTVYCRQRRSSAGRVQLQPGFEYPAPQMIGEFSQLNRDVSSGEVTVLNDRQIMIKNYTYDGLGPATYFYVGVTPEVMTQVLPYGIIPDETGQSTDIARQYTGEDITLTLPENLSFANLSWLSMWCARAEANFGNVFFAQPLNVPVYFDKSLLEPRIRCRGNRQCIRERRQQRQAQN